MKNILQNNRKGVEILLQWAGIILILEIGLIHIIGSQQHYNESALIGYLFAANFFASLIAAFAIYRSLAFGWWLSLIIAISSMTGYVMSRTVGLPGLALKTWISPMGVTAFILEFIFVIVFLLVKPWQPWRTASGDEIVTSGWSRFAFPALAVVLIAVISLAAIRWHDSWYQVQNRSFHSLADAKALPVVSAAELQSRYGIAISRAAISALDSIVDIRIRVFNPDKAHQLFDESSAILVDEQNLVLAPQKHAHESIKPGQIYVMFYPTQNKTVKSGSEISLVFDDFRVEPVTVK